MLKFLYLNTYAFLIILIGVLVFALPFYKISIWIFIIQAVIVIKLFATAGRLLAVWNNKKRGIYILLRKNRNEFRPEVFSDYMQAPCGRLVVKYTLSQLGKPNEYKKLLKMKKPVLQSINCIPAKTAIYINDKFRNDIGS
jgi:hypothetical protein